ncbi:hypothetical protein [Vibrio sp. SCSIO 43137]|nr:hypothetical protein [Vibrio sp. SCSIO 43137]WCE31844.1 hypothetical protein PK654_22225 [Vibrio sp. SCSIO 43137]
MYIPNLFVAMPARMPAQQLTIRYQIFTFGELNEAEVEQEGKRLAIDCHR